MQKLRDFAGATCVAVALVLSCKSNAQSFSLDLPKESRPVIRKSDRTPEVFLIPVDQKKRTSVGIPLGTPDLLTFEKGLRATVADKGVEVFRDTSFWVFGVEMKNEKQTRAEYQALLHELGLDRVGARVVVYSVPSALIKERLEKTWSGFFERMAYYFPSVTRDFQMPFVSEALLAFTLVSLTNVYNVAFVLPKSLDGIEYGLTAVMHLALNYSTNIFYKFQTNWTNRYQTQPKWSQWIERNSKQAILTLFFVINYNIFGNITDISQFFASDLEWADKMSVAWGATGTFLKAQLMTIALSCIYYTTYNANGFGKWLVSVDGVERSEVAQKILPWIRVPTSTLQTALLAISSTSAAAPLLDVGFLEARPGHAYFVAAIAAGAYFFWKWPHALDRVLDGAMKMRDLGRMINDPGTHHQKRARLAACFEL